jgi:hypothetical protein
MVAKGLDVIVDKLKLCNPSTSSHPEVTAQHPGLLNNFTQLLIYITNSLTIMQLQNN